MTNKKWIAFSTLMFILGFGIAFTIASITWLNFVDRFTEFPYNQGLYAGMATGFYELKNQGFDLNNSDLNVELLSLEYYAIMSSLHKEHGSDSISCWLIDIGEQHSDRQGYNCELYDQEKQRARELLK